MNRLELWHLRWALRGDRSAYWPWPRCPKCHNNYGSRVVDNSHNVVVRCDWDGTWWTIPVGY